MTNALKELRNEGDIVRLDKSDIPELNNLKASSLTFYVNTNATRTDHEFSIVKKHAVSTVKLVGVYSDPDTIRVKGNQLESLVETQLQILQFKIVGKNTNKYNGIKWTKTNHNLDFIAEKNNLVIGVEVKNTLDIIPPDEIDRKIDLYRHLGIIPVFAVRWIKPYVNCIHRQG